jgi:uncharacterized membrane protein YfcA
VSVVGAMAIGLVAGAVAGVMGVGGGILFVPALSVLLGESHIDAEATSLLAIVPVAFVGTWRQARYGNVRLREGLLLGTLSVLGVLAGAIVANAVSQRALEVAFSVLILLVALQLAQDSLRRDDSRAEQAARGRAPGSV